MDNETKKRGRPKAQPQSGPLVLEGNRAHVKIEIEMPEATADELKEYARWVELSSSVATKDALVKTVDFALRDVFKRDRLWQERRRKGAQPAPAPAPISAAPAPPTSSSPTLPPPTNGARAVLPTPATPPGGR
jgi:hypothetical protein